MKITFVPQRNDNTMEINKQGETLTVNGTAYDFSSIVSDVDWIALHEDAPSQFYEMFVPMLLDVRRVDGELEFVFAFPYAAGEQPDFEKAVLTNVPDGPIDLPA